MTTRRHTPTPHVLRDAPDLANPPRSRTTPAVTPVATADEWPRTDAVTQSPAATSGGGRVPAHANLLNIAKDSPAAVVSPRPRPRRPGIQPGQDG